jgi:hypothetical protein
MEQLLWGTDELYSSPCGTYFVDTKRALHRTAWVVLTGLVALYADFGFLTSLTGCLSNALLAFVLPPWFYLALFWKHYREKTSWNLLVISFNVTLAIAGTAFAAGSSFVLIREKILNPK